MLLPTAVLLCLTTSCRDVHDPAGVQRPDLIPAYVITEDSLELFPDADRYDSSSGTPSTGTETTLPLTKDRRPMLRWDSAGLADAIGSDSLIEAFLDLTIVSYDGGWGGQGKQAAGLALEELQQEGGSSAGEDQDGKPRAQGQKEQENGGPHTGMTPSGRGGTGRRFIPPSSSIPPAPG